MEACPVVPTPWHPAVGVSIGILALIGVLIPLVHERITNRTEKAIWIFAVAVCFSFEWWAITWDQVERDRERNHVECEQFHNFQDVADQLDRTRQKMYQNLAETQQAERVATSSLIETQQTERMAKANLAEVSGEGSHPCIVPDEMAMTGDLVPFSIWNRGENMLTGVEVVMKNMPEYQIGRMLGRMDPVSIGTLRSEWPKTLPAIRPQIDFNNIGHYNAEIWTQNGVYNETLNFRKAIKGPRVWAYQYWLSKQVVFKGPTKQFPQMRNGDRMSVVMDDCRRPEWSDGSKETQ